MSLKTSSIWLYIFDSQLLAQTLRGVKTGPQCAHHRAAVDARNSHSLAHSWLGGSVTHTCAAFDAPLLLVDGVGMFVLCPRLCPHVSLSHVNVLHCLSFSLKPTDQ